MKFLHTADWQLGMKAAQVGAAGDRGSNPSFVPNNLSGLSLVPEGW